MKDDNTIKKRKRPTRPWEWKPRKYPKSDIDRFKENIDKYFWSITRTTPVTKTTVVWKDKNNKEIIESQPILDNNWDPILNTEYIRPPTICWLCNYIWISQDTWIDYEKEEEYSGTIKKARQIIEQYNVELLYRKEQVTWVIFNLKNNYWRKDKTEVDNTNTNYNGELTKEEMKKLLERFELDK